MDLLATAAMISMVRRRNDAIWHAHATEVIVSERFNKQHTLLNDILLALQSIVTVVTGWYAMNLDNKHPQSFPAFYTVSLTILQSLLPVLRCQLRAELALLAVLTA